MSSPEPRSIPSSRRQVQLLAVALFVLTAALYARVREYQFLQYDDVVYVTKEPMVRAGLTWEGVRWAFTHFHASFWHPLTSLSLMLDQQLWGSGPAGFHVTNALLHAANTVLLFIALHQLTGARWRSAVVAALFAWHPLHVESVAWIAQRKDVLSTLFMFATLIAYARYVRVPRWPRYALTLVLFALGLMAKPMLVTLPFLLLLLDAWPLRRFSAGDDRRRIAVRLIREKLPFLAAALAASVAKIIGHQNDAIVPYPLPLRLENAVVSYLAYLGKTIWPENLTFYEFPASIPLAQVAIAATALGAITAGVAVAWRRAPYLAIGWLWFAGMLVPVSGIVQIASHSMADRYTYVSLVGLFIAVVWAVDDLTRRWANRRAPLACATVVVLALAATLTAKQLRCWRSQLTLFQHAVEAAPENPISLNNLAWIRAAHPDAKYRDGAEAVRLAQRAARLMPGAPALLDTLAAALAETGRFDEAIDVAQRAAAAAAATHDDELAANLRERLRRYRNHEPVRDESVR